MLTHQFKSAKRLVLMELSSEEASRAQQVDTTLFDENVVSPVGLAEELSDTDLQEALTVFLDQEYECEQDALNEEKRRIHRESMARTRKQLRLSIDKLRLEEAELVLQLRRSISNFRPLQPSDPCFKIHNAYYKLVQEQLRRQQERQSLDQTWKDKDKYGRLVQRELSRVTNSDQSSELDTGVETRKPP